VISSRIKDSLLHGANVVLRGREVPEKAVGEFFKVPGVSQKAGGVQNRRPNNPKYAKYHG
jgi:hypothetical protein